MPSTKSTRHKRDYEKKLTRKCEKFYSDYYLVASFWIFYLDFGIKRIDKNENDRPATNGLMDEQREDEADEEKCQESDFRRIVFVLFETIRQCLLQQQQRVGVGAQIDE